MAPGDETPCEEERGPEPDASRREFLRRSAYAAYATPLITALLVENAAAGHSGCPPSKKERCRSGQLPPQACKKCF